MQSVRDIKQKIKVAATSNRGRNILTFAVFLVISTIFWFIMALSNEVQHEFEVPLKINKIPKDVTILNNIPAKISVNVKDKGIALIRWDWGKIPNLDLDYSQFRNNGQNLFMNSTQLTGIVRSIFGGTANIVEIKPDSISLNYTTNPGVRKPIKIRASVNAAPQYTVNGPITLSTDSVDLFSASVIPGKTIVETDTIDLSGLTDTTYVKVALHAPDGIKVVPSTVTLMVPVEPLISKTQTIPVTVVNTPDSLRVITFPSGVEISYTVPISIYNHDNYDIKALAPFSLNERKLGIILSNIPPVYNNVRLLTDSVEYLVERR